MQAKLIKQTTGKKVHDRTYYIQCGKCKKIKKIDYKHYRMIFPAKKTTKQRTSGICVECKNTKPNKSSFKKGHTPHNKGKGVKGDFWTKIKASKRWKDLRKAVFERDDYTCQDCGVKGGVLHPDHIKPKSIYPKLIFEIDNIRTLCRECHRKTDTYGYKAIKLSTNTNNHGKRN